MKRILLSASIILVLFLAGGCASQEGMQEETVRKHGANTSAFSFSEEKDGKQIYYEAVFKGKELADLYIDGKKVPEGELDQHKTHVESKMREITKKDFSHVRSFKFDSDKFKKDMKKFKEEMKSKNWELSSKIFDKEEFRAQMDKLNEELSKLKELEININFDEKDIKEHLDRAKDHIESINMDKIKIDIDLQMEKLDEEMKNLEENLKDMDLDFDELGSHLEKLESFIDEMKSEMVNDNLIINKEEEFDLELGKDKMTVNGKEVSSQLHNKYKELYRKHMGEELTEKRTFTIR